MPRRIEPTTGFLRFLFEASIPRFSDVSILLKWYGDSYKVLLLVDERDDYDDGDVDDGRCCGGGSISDDGDIDDGRRCGGGGVGDDGDIDDGRCCGPGSVGDDGDNDDGRCCGPGSVGDDAEDHMTNESFIVYKRRERWLTDRAVGYQVRGPRFESQSKPSQFFLLFCVYPALNG
ncbi:hypothetical protein PoB_004740300 [Plakobranchus ocellatus]|uniref:Uncharacterized protein n=1 Tax=Plakobranchus ocellatus TaxID=259542 RepID=A0AAV4BP39_9GAST|nr:hypothetical protein PoB_004740300 [Plakobranchus ocellatus]